MIALDLFVGLFTSDLPANDAVVLCWVLLQSYGPRKRKDIHLDFAEIEDYTGLHRNNARASTKSLVASGYLRHNADGTYRFLKDWEHYRPKRGAFVERLKLARFAQAVLTHEKFINPSKSKAIQSNCPSTPTPIQVNCPDKSKGNSSELGSSPEGQFKRIGTTIDATHQNGSATSNVVKDLRNGLAGARERTPAPASEDLETKKTEDYLSLSARAGFAISRNGEEPEEPFIANGQPASAGFMPPSLTPSERSELDRAIAFAEASFPMLEIGKGISGQPKPIDGMEISWWLPALEGMAQQKNRSKHDWVYLLAILRKIRANGGPTIESRNSLDSNAVPGSASPRKPTNAELGARMKVHMQELAERSGGHRAKRS